MEQADKNDVAGLQRVKDALLDARRQLIDLTRRNRLLHTLRTGNRPHCLEINADPDVVFSALTRTAKQFGFAPLSEDAEFTATAQGKTNGSALQRLQTRLAREALDGRLLKLFREARTFEEEQGANILFLAIGFLNWFEDARSEELCSAPLLLVPVSLERRQGRDPFVLRGRDDDMIVNVSLAEKLRGTFGITLPELPEGDEWLPSMYFDTVQTAVSGEKRWEVDRIGIGLGFFTFSKLLMWRDLDAASWPQPGKLLENQLVAKLLGEGLSSNPEPSLAADDEPIDERIDLAAAIHVLDADSSQAVCVDEVRRGRNLVVQGPPGTGKSQTIANIIATAAHEGKSVLFVAEKAAALDVVHSRLTAVGLGPLCLEIHSKKATKLSVIGSLERSIRAAEVPHVDGQTAAALRVARDRLNDWSATLHREIQQSGRTPFQLIGTVVKLRSEGVRVLPQRLDQAAEWNRERLHESERAVERASLAVRKLGVPPVDHPWYGALGVRVTPFDAERLSSALEEGCRCGNDLLAGGRKVAALLRATRDMRCVDVHSFVEALRCLARAPKDCRETFRHAAWRSERQRITQLIEEGKIWSSNVAELADRVVETAWTFEIGPVRRAIAVHGRSIFRSFVGCYRRAVSDLRGLCRGPAPRRFEDRIDLLDKLLAAQSARRKVEDEREFAEAVFGAIWTSETTQWTAIESFVTWANGADQFHLAADLLEVAGSVDPQSCSSMADDLETALVAFRTAFKRIAEIVCPNNIEVFGIADVEHVPLVALLGQLEEWVLSLGEFNDWVSARDALNNLVSLEMEVIAQGLNNGSIEASEAPSIAKLLIAEALWRRALLKDPTLGQIDGAYRSEVVLDFRALDRKRIELARTEVLSRYLQDRPNGEAGEMGIVRAEIAKKRRHLPIRKLMEQAGSALQKLKPVFLMSPLSVAQFLPPGQMTFDLVVIDEASQVSPEDALGVIARGRKMVVVGDDKQLPPTNFFKMVSADEDDQEDEQSTNAVGRTKDFESVLTLARARGVAERMLRWHYRSRHHSLIALSNHMCYSGRLLLPPSPLAESDHLGLSMVQTPRGHYDRGGSGRNSAEADKIAAAVEDHLQKSPDRSLGLACFSVAQRDAIEDSLQARGILAAAEAFSPRGERLFIKNLEAVQGDERDVIFISIGYGPDAHGRMTAGFGPLSADGGERRLNVLISRARLQCVVFSSITAGDIPADAKPLGTRMLREFLHYAETKHIAAGQVTGTDFDSPFEEAVAIAVRRCGHDVRPQVGVAGFRIDLGVLDPEMPGRFLLGIECDGATYHSGRSARDRDRLRQEVLESLGWRLHRIWSTDWFRSPQREVDRLLLAIEQARVDGGTEVKSPLVGVTRKVAASHFNNPGTIAPPEKNDNTSSPVQIPSVRCSEPYKEFKLRVDRGLDLLQIGRDALAELAASVVLNEGPIHVEEVARRVREAFGLGRTGRRILEMIQDALGQVAGQGRILRDGEFWSSTNSVLKTARCRRDAAITLRRADRIPPEEYRLAVTTILNAAVAISRSELTVGVARIFGFDRTGNDLDRAISDQIDRMIQTRQIQDSEGKLQLIGA